MIKIKKVKKRNIETENRYSIPSVNVRGSGFTYKLQEGEDNVHKFDNLQIRNLLSTAYLSIMSIAVRASLCVLYLTNLILCCEYFICYLLFDVI